MCGIVGISATGNIVDTTVDCLQRLEYRGYDSFGLSAVTEGRIETRKDVGSIGEKGNSGFFDDMAASATAVAHTRWATHGGVTVPNAHPHLSYDGSLALVHNGVIENHEQLRGLVSGEVSDFASETDSEVIAHLLAKFIGESDDIVAAIFKVNALLEGEYAFAFITLRDPATLYATRHKSPLAVAWRPDLAIVASDQQAILLLSRDVCFLEDGDVVRAGLTSCRVYRRLGEGFEEVQRPAISLEAGNDVVDKGDYDHFMLKEVHESPAAVRQALAIDTDDVRRVVEDLHESEINLTGAGSAYFVAQMGQYFFANLAKRYAFTHPSDEFLNLKDFRRTDHLIAISQSGETFDTLEVIRAALAHNATVTSVNNVESSTCQRLATFPVLQNAGPEICVLSTKSILSQMAILFRFAVELGVRDGALLDDHAARIREELAQLPAHLERMLGDCSGRIREVAQRHAGIEHWFFIGRGIYYPVAMESALKFKEVSYLHAEGMPSGFFKHGTISLINDDFYTVAFIPNRFVDRELFGFTMSNVSEIEARGGKIIAFTTDQELKDHPGIFECIELPSLSRYLDSAVVTSAAQLFAYYCALKLGRSIDKPRALAKSVTVR